MPHPIPDWDVPRILVKFIASRQMAGRPSTLKELSNRMGLGIGYMLDLMDRFGIVYALDCNKEERRGSAKIFITDVPDTLAFDSGISRQAIRDSFDQVDKTKVVQRKVVEKKISFKEIQEKRREQKKKLINFLSS